MASILNLNGDFLGIPAVVSWEPGRTDVFVRGPTNSVLHKFQRTPGDKWLPSESENIWETLAGDAFSDITAVSWGPHRIDLFWIGACNAIQHLFWNGTKWDLETLDGAAIGTIAAGSWGIGKLAVFHRGTDNVVYVNLWHNSKWDGWSKLGGEIVGSPVAVSYEENRVDIFHRGGGLDIYHKSFDGNTMKWSDNWECTAVGAILIDDITAVSPAPGIIYLFGIGTTNGVFVQTYSRGKWGRWEALGGNTRSKPSAVAFEGAAIGVAVQGHDNAVNVNVRQSPDSNWTGWQQVGDKYLATQMPVLHPRATFNMVSFVRDPAANLVIVKRNVTSTGTA